MSEFCRTRISALVSFAVIAMAPGVAGAQTLTEVVKKALVDYPQVRAANSKIDAARADIARAKSAHLPQIGLNSSLSAYASGGTPASVGSTNLSPTARINLWSGGRIAADVDKSEALTRAAEQALSSTRDDVALSAAEAYLSWIKAVDLHDLAKMNLEVHEQLAQDISKIVAVDQGRRIDLTQAQVRRESAALIAQQRGADVALAEQRVRRFWGAAVGSSPSSVDAELSQDGPLGWVPATNEEALALLTDGMPGLAQFVSQITVAQAAVAQAKGLKHPSLDLNTSRQFNTNSQRQDFLTQITMTMPVYNGGQSDAQIQTALAQLQTAQFNLEDARLAAAEKLSLVWQEWSSNSKRANLANNQSNTGDLLIEGYKAQFRIGRRSLLDLLNVHNDAFNYASAARAALHDERIGRARVLAALDTLADKFEKAQVIASAGKPVLQQAPRPEPAAAVVAVAEPMPVERSLAVITPAQEPQAPVVASAPDPTPVLAPAPLAQLPMQALDKRADVTQGPKIFTMAGNGLFKFRGSSMDDFTPEGIDHLKRIIRDLKRLPTSQIEITGHTDGLGTDEINMPMSEKRANAVRDFLVQAGISGSNITAIGKGSQEPVKVCPGTRAVRIVCEAPNRRVVIAVMPKTEK